MSHALLRNLLQAGIEARLTKNEWAVYATLLTQTLGYGKASDALTTKRIAFQSGIRKDRAEIALAGVLKHGLFKVKDHPRWGHEYSIPEQYLSPAQRERFFAPDLPQTRKPPRNSEAFSENRRHTEINLYRIKPTQPTNPSPSPPTTDTSPPPPLPHSCRPQQLRIPPEISAQLLQSLRSALQTLSDDDAQCIVDLLASALRQGSVRHPLRYAYGLINRLHAGTLNRSDLAINSPPIPPPLPQQAANTQRALAHQHAAEQAMLERLASLGGVPIEQLGGAAS